VDQKPMPIRVNIRHAAVVAFEMQAVRRDRSVQTLVRSKRDSAADDVGCATNDTLYVFFESRGLPIGSHVGARRSHPWWNFERLCAGRPRGHQSGATSEQRGPLAEKKSAMQQAVSSNDLDSPILI
jgi:hypothetical protein